MTEAEEKLIEDIDKVISKIKGISIYYELKKRESQEECTNAVINGNTAEAMKHASMSDYFTDILVSINT